MVHVCSQRTRHTLSSFPFFSFPRGQASCNPGWPQTCNITKNGFESPTLLPPVCTSSSTQFLTWKLAKIRSVMEWNKQKGLTDGVTSLTVSASVPFILASLAIVSQLHQSHWEGRRCPHSTDGHLSSHPPAGWKRPGTRAGISNRKIHTSYGKALEWVWSFSRGWRVTLKAL